MQANRALFPVLAFGGLMLAGACGSNPTGSSGNNSNPSHRDAGSAGSDSGDAIVGGDDSGSIFVSNLGDGGVMTTTLPRCITATQQCVKTCSGGGETTLTGTVYDPAGKNPLYGIVVYVPSQPPAPISTGASCYSCNS